MLFVEITQKAKEIPVEKGKEMKLTTQNIFLSLTSFPLLKGQFTHVTRIRDGETMRNSISLGFNIFLYAEAFLGILQLLVGHKSSSCSSTQFFTDGILRVFSRSRSIRAGSNGIAF